MVGGLKLFIALQRFWWQNVCGRIIEGKGLWFKLLKQKILIPYLLRSGLEQVIKIYSMFL